MADGAVPTSRAPQGSTRGALDSIANAIATLDEPPDVVCLQEVETRSVRSRLCHTPRATNETQLESLMLVLEAALAREKRVVRYVGHYFPAHTYRMRKTNIYTTGLAILVDERREEAHFVEKRVSHFPPCFERQGGELLRAGNIGNEVETLVYKEHQ